MEIRIRGILGVSAVVVFGYLSLDGGLNACHMLVLDHDQGGVYHELRMYLATGNLKRNL
ncbi:hypothetical protein BO71DRAFT_365039, partial [Aspergillus ellipticus CBS 707.79]